MGWRQSCCGGWWAQSASRCTDGIRALRSAPRKPGKSTLAGALPLCVLFVAIVKLPLNSGFLGDHFQTNTGVPVPSRDPSIRTIFESPNSRARITARLTNRVRHRNPLRKMSHTNTPPSPQVIAMKMRKFFMLVSTSSRPFTYQMRTATNANITARIHQRTRRGFAGGTGGDLGAGGLVFSMESLISVAGLVAGRSPASWHIFRNRATGRNVVNRDSKTRSPSPESSTPNYLHMLDASIDQSLGSNVLAVEHRSHELTCGGLGDAFGLTKRAADSHHGDRTGAAEIKPITLLIHGRVIDLELVGLRRHTACVDLF